MLKALYARGPGGKPALVHAPSAATATKPRVLRRDDFEIGRIIGVGSFGYVHSACIKDTGEPVVIKAVSKATCIKNGQVRHLRDERQLLARLSVIDHHPFLVNLRGSYQDDRNVYLVLDYVAGGDLFCYLRSYPARHGHIMKEDHARFYIAQLVLALEHLHNQGIAHRDIKPENILIGKDGYIKLTDFGFAKEISGCTHTTCGTPDYSAPEIIRAQGHGPAVDLWALGAVTYEILYGFPPFYASGDVALTYRQALARDLRLPQEWSPQVKDIINRLLQTDSSQRLGSGPNGIAALKNHPWFAGLDWKHVAAKRYTPPHVPKVAGKTDTSNFDDFSQLPPMHHPFILTAEQQALFDCF